MFTDVVLVFLTVVQLLQVAHGAQPYDFSSVGPFKASPKRNSSTMVTTTSTSQIQCCIMCATTASCVAVNYENKLRRCTLYELEMWTLTFNTDFTFLLQGSALNSTARREYQTIKGAISDSIEVNNAENYTVASFPNSTQCQYFCELVVGPCYAFQFHSILKECRIFIGDYKSLNLTFDTDDHNWSVFYDLRAADGPYRKLPGAYPTTTAFPTYTANNVPNSLFCRKLCEQQSTSNCTLYAFNSNLNQCYVFRPTVPSNFLFMNFTATDWITYYAGNIEPPDWGRNYYFMIRSAEWRDTANQICLQTYGAMLADIKSEEEQKFITDLITVNSVLNGRRFWIGYKTEGKPFYFTAPCDGSALTYSHWSTGEPSDGDEFCVQLYQDKSWNNENCRSNMNFICKTCPGVGFS